LGIGDWGLGIGDWAQSPIPMLLILLSFKIYKNIKFNLNIFFNLLIIFQVKDSNVKYSIKIYIIFNPTKFYS